MCGALVSLYTSLFVVVDLSRLEPNLVFQAVLKADPSFEEAPWPTMSSEAKDFVKCLLNKDFIIILHYSIS